MTSTVEVTFSRPTKTSSTVRMASAPPAGPFATVTFATPCRLLDTLWARVEASGSAPLRVTDVVCLAMEGGPGDAPELLELLGDQRGPAAYSCSTSSPIRHAR